MPPVPPPGTVAAQAEYSTQPLAVEEDLTLLTEVENALEGGDMVLRLELPGEGATEQVDDGELALEMCRLLSTGTYTALDGQAQGLHEGAGDAIAFYLDDDGRRYAVRLYNSGNSHPDYPDRTVVEVERQTTDEADFGVFLTDRAVFDNLLSLCLTSLSRLPLSVSHPFVELNSGFDLQMLETGAGLIVCEVLEAGGNRMIWRFYEQGYDMRPSYIEVFDTETGEILGSYIIEEPVERMELSREESGYDYRIFTGNRILYKNSKDPGKEKAYTLPPSVKLRPWEAMTRQGSFDLKDGKLVWAAEDGIYLADVNGENAKMVLNNGEIAAQAGSRAESWSSAYYTEPRLLNGGQQVSARVESDFNNGAGGLVVTDLSDSTVMTFYDLFARSFVGIDYPSDKTIAVTNLEETALIDVPTGETKKLDFSTAEARENPQTSQRWISADYRRFVVTEQNWDSNDLSAWVVPSRKPDDRSKPLLEVTGDGTFYFVGITEKYLLAKALDSDGIQYLIMEY